MKGKTWVLCCLVLFILCIIGFMGLLILNRLAFKSKLARQKKQGEGDKFDNITDDNVLEMFQRSAAFTNRIKKMKKTIRNINQHQHIFNNNNSSMNDTTVLVIRIHDNKTYVTIFLESLSRVKGINASLLIFAHDYYDDEINSVVRDMRCSRIMQIFYPYSIQLHPNMYPGEDARYYEKLNQYVDSKRRDPILAQTKLFWWWTVNQVFDYVKILKNYSGYIYFLDIESYLVSDIMHIVRKMEELQPKFCPDCQILSLGSVHPQPEMYYPEHSYLIISTWGWSNYSNSGIGFNRKTWNEINGLSEHFCYFKDSSWEYSLRYSITKAHGPFHMLSTEGPRIFPTANCVAFKTRPDCDLHSNYHDILKFLPKINHGRLPQKFKVKYVGTKVGSMVPRGQWGDARDVDLCMYFSSKDRREEY